MTYNNLYGLVGMVKDSSLTKMHAKVWVSIVQVERSNNKKINRFLYLANDFHNGRKRRKFIFETLIKISNTSTKTESADQISPAATADSVYSVYDT